MDIQWLLKPFNDLTPQQLYAAMQLRNEVFVVEQACVFQDADDNDQPAYHLLGYQMEKLVAYTRLLPAGTFYKEASIGRVVTSPAARGKGMGRELMRQSIESAYQLFGKAPVKIGAQLYLKKFYESFGFLSISEVYMEDGIPHIHMLKTPS